MDVIVLVFLFLVVGTLLILILRSGLMRSERRDESVIMIPFAGLMVFEIIFTACLVMSIYKAIKG